MGLPKGRTNNEAGRPKGTPNKVTAAVKEKIENFIDSKMTEMESMWKEMTAAEKASFMVKLMDFVVPRLRSQDIQVSEFETLSDEQLKELANEIINQSKL